MSSGGSVVVIGRFRRLMILGDGLDRFEVEHTDRLPDIGEAEGVGGRSKRTARSSQSVTCLIVD